MSEDIFLLAIAAMVVAGGLIVVGVGTLLDRRRSRRELQATLEAERQVLRSIAAADYAKKFGTRTRGNGRAQEREPL